MKDRIEALARGVQGGIFSPNEARNSEGLPDAIFGDEPRVQQQVVPLSAAAKIRTDNYAITASTAIACTTGRATGAAAEGLSR